MLLTCEYMQEGYCEGCPHHGDHLAFPECITKKCEHAPKMFIEVNLSCKMCTHQTECKQYDPEDIIDLMDDPSKCKAYKDLDINVKCIPAASPHIEGTCLPEKENENGKQRCKDCGRYYNEDTETWDVKYKKKFKSNWQNNLNNRRN